MSLSSSIHSLVIISPPYTIKISAIKNPAIGKAIHNGSSLDNTQQVNTINSNFAAHIISSFSSIRVSLEVQQFALPIVSVLQNFHTLSIYGENLLYKAFLNLTKLMDIPCKDSDKESSGQLLQHIHHHSKSILATHPSVSADFPQAISTFFYEL